MFFYLSFSKHTTPPRETEREKNEAFAYEILTPCIDCLSHKSTGVSFSQKYSMKLTAKLRQTSMCLLVSVYALVCVCVFVCEYVFCSRMGFATAVSRGWGNLVVEVEDAPGAFVEGHCAGEPRGRSAVN